MANEDPTDDDFDPEIQCWCGAKGTYSDLCDDSGLESGCGGTGILHCYCGGDFCVCHHHGEAECFGCEDCDRGDPDDDGGKWEEDDGRYDEEDLSMNWPEQKPEPDPRDEP